MSISQYSEQEAYKMSFSSFSESFIKEIENDLLSTKVMKFRDKN